MNKKTLNRYVTLPFPLMLALLLSWPVAQAGEAESSDQAMTFDGLTLKKETKRTVVYAKEGWDWSDYRKVQVLDAQVAFRKNWQRDYNRDAMGTSGRIKDKDVLRIKSEMAALFKEKFSSKFAESSFELVSEPDEGTLLLRPAIINLDVTAPDIMTAGRSKTFVRSAGSATLYLEVYDAVSGEILARVMDYRQAPEGHAQWATRVSNKAEASRIINNWATRLIEALESAKAGD